MKKYIVKCCAAAALLGFSNSAYASDGTISFTGSVTNATCTVKVNNGSANGTVTLPNVSQSALAASGAIAGATTFALNLSGCTAGHTVDAFFEAGPTVNTVTGNLVNGGSAGNVQVQLLNAAGTTIAIGSGTQAIDTGIATSSSVTSGTLSYVAQYYATGASTSGTVTSSVTYSLTYN